MRKRQPLPQPSRAALICLAILSPLAANANPVAIHPQSLIAFGVVVLMAMLVEAGIVALLLTFSGLEPFRLFGGFFFANVGVFLFLFFPLLERESLPLPVLEGLVVGADGLAIWMLSKLSSMQGDAYSGLSWRSAVLAALAGNAASFFVGVIATGAPWVDHGMNASLH